MAGQRYSRQRELILEYMQHTKTHPTAEMVYEALRSKHTGLSLATVYRNLKLLAQDGIIIRIPLPVERYDGTTVEHPHFWCKCCNQVMDVEEYEFVSFVQQAAKDLSHQVERLEILFTGVCDQCAQHAVMDHSAEPLQNQLM